MEKVIIFREVDDPTLSLASDSIDRNIPNAVRDFDQSLTIELTELYQDIYIEIVSRMLTEMNYKPIVTDYSNTSEAKAFRKRYPKALLLEDVRYPAGLAAELADAEFDKLLPEALVNMGLEDIK